MLKKLCRWDAIYQYVAAVCDKPDSHGLYGKGKAVLSSKLLVLMGFTR